MAAKLQVFVPRRDVALNSINSTSDVSPATFNVLRQKLMDCIQEATGDIASMSLALQITQCYVNLPVSARLRFLLMLSNDFGVDRGKLRRAVAQFAEVAFKRTDTRAQERLEEALTPASALFFDRLAACPGGLPLLISLRADLLQLVLEPLSRNETPKSIGTVTPSQSEGVLQDVVKMLQRYLASGSNLPPVVSVPGEERREEQPAKASRQNFTWTEDVTALITADTPSELQRMDRTIISTLKTHFAVAHLYFTRLSWDSPVALVDTIPKFEAVHPIENVDQLKMRLSRRDRSCYSILHHQMPLRPLIVVHVAFRSSIATKTSEVLSPNVPDSDPLLATCAVFYSISAAEPGLKGIGFGTILIRRVLELVVEQYPRIHTCLTLSPVPGFMKWLNFTDTIPVGLPFISPTEAATISKLSGQSTPLAGLRKIIADRIAAGGGELDPVLQKPLMSLCARYLIGPFSAANASTMDSVARFHIGNGARLEHMHWNANITVRGLRESAGIMVSYQYVLDFGELDQNHHAFVRTRVIPASPTVAALLHPPIDSLARL